MVVAISLTATTTHISELSNRSVRSAITFFGIDWVFEKFVKFSAGEGRSDCARFSGVGSSAVVWCATGSISGALVGRDDRNGWVEGTGVANIDHFTVQSWFGWLWHANHPLERLTQWESVLGECVGWLRFGWTIITSYNCGGKCNKIFGKGVFDQRVFTFSKYTFYKLFELWMWFQFAQFRRCVFPRTCIIKFSDSFPLCVWYQFAYESIRFGSVSREVFFLLQLRFVVANDVSCYTPVTVTSWMTVSCGNG